jgi:Palmitoyl protein thioesterase
MRGRIIAAHDSPGQATLNLATQFTLRRLAHDCSDRTHDDDDDVKSSGASGRRRQSVRRVTFVRKAGQTALHFIDPQLIVQRAYVQNRSMIAKAMNPERMPKARFLPHQEISSPVPILCEPCSLLEFATLRMSPVYYGLGVPAGDGRAVVIVPGFLGIDLILFELHAWLARISYRPYFSGMGLAAECPDVLAQNLLLTIERAYVETGRRVHLVGHSLGGIFARSAAVRMPDHIASVTTLGSPFRGLVVHPSFLHSPTSYAAASASGKQSRRRNVRPAGAHAPSGAVSAGDGQGR